MQLSAQKLLFSLRRTEFQKSQKFYFERERPRCRCRGGGAKHLTFQLQFCIQCKLCKRRKDFSPSLFKENFIFLIYCINDLGLIAKRVISNNVDRLSNSRLRGLAYIRINAYSRLKVLNGFPILLLESFFLPFYQAKATNFSVSPAHFPITSEL